MQQSPCACVLADTGPGLCLQSATRTRATWTTTTHPQGNWRTRGNALFGENGAGGAGGTGDGGGFGGAGGTDDGGCQYQGGREEGAPAAAATAVNGGGTGGMEMGGYRALRSAMSRGAR